MMKNLPTILTVSRMTMGPILAALILWAGEVVYADPLLAAVIYALSLMLFLVAAMSDWVDGWLARKLDAVTPLGAALDHSADKVLIASVLVALAYASLPMDFAAAAVIILGRDVAVAGLREGLSHSGRALPVSQLGKWKAAAEMAGVGVYLAFQTASLLQLSAQVVIGLFWAARILIWAGAAFALFSGALYARAAVRRT